MAELAEIIAQIEQTEEALVRTEREMRSSPEDRSLRLILASLEKRQGDLSIQFEHATAAHGLDVCTYRLFDRFDQRPHVRSFANALRDFQDLITTVYDAIKNGPKERARVGVESVAATSFGFGYTFTGSLGFVLTLPNEQLLFDSMLDDAVETVFKLTESASSAEVAEFAKRLGRAPVHIAYQWASHHAEAGLGADIRWTRASREKRAVFLQPPDNAKLQSAIEATSDMREETFTWVGVLLGGDVKTGAFHMSFEGGEDIRGKMAPDLAPEEKLILKERYRAT